MNRLQATNEIADFIARQNPKNVLKFKISKAAKTQVYNLMDKQKTSKLTAQEQTELEYYNVLEHIMRLAKAKAYQLTVHN